MGKKNIIVLLVFISWFLSSGILAEDTISKSSADSDLTEYTLPQITVIGDTSLGSLERDVIKAYEVKFEVFNNLNSTDDYDITCEWVAPLGTRIKKWSCDVAYLKKARANNVIDWKENGAPLDSESQLSAKYAYKTRALNQEMKALAARYPELAVAMIDAHEKEQLYKEEIRRRYKDSIFVGDPPEPELKLNKLDIWAAAFLDHKNGLMSDAIWARWDSLYRKIFKLRSYQNLWTSLNHNKYTEDFVAYVNTIIAGN